MLTTPNIHFISIYLNALLIFISAIILIDALVRVHAQSFLKFKCAVILLSGLNFAYLLFTLMIGL